MLIDPTTYHSLEHAQLERERLFPRVWLVAAHLSQLPAPSSVLPFSVGSDPLLLVRDGERVRAFHDVCRHRGAQLSRGSGPCTRLRCAYHGWEYGLDGALALAPGASPTQAQDRPGLHPIACEVRHGWVWIAMEPERSLDAWLEPIAALLSNTPSLRVRVEHAHRLEVPCNWKVSCDVHNEAYHLTTLHPELKGLIDPEQIEVEAHGLHTHFRIPIAGPLSVRIKHQLFLFPNVQLNWTEGDDAIELYRHWPHKSSPSQAHFEELRLGPGLPTSAGAMESFAFGERSFGPITDADLAMLPILQAGLSSRGAESLRLHRLELPIAHMHKGIAQFIEAEFRGAP